MKRNQWRKFKDNQKQIWSSKKLKRTTKGRSKRKRVDWGEDQDGWNRRPAQTETESRAV